MKKSAGLANIGESIRTLNAKSVFDFTLNNSIIIFVVIAIVVTSIIYPYFLGLENLGNLIRNMAPRLL
ncbi:MAG: hypothetical protein FWC62_07190, partial [Firmicutes bacterium]|nr:hypothetical protein [Bacillota bacterium]